MSSAILYLAIIAIWAGFLVPAWVRRPHAIHGDAHAEDETEVPAPGDGELIVEYVTETESGAGAAHEAGSYAGVRRDGQDDDYAGADYEHAGYEHAAAGYAGAGYEDGYAAGPGDGLGDGADVRPGSQRPSQSREQMLRARRRMLTILVSMTLVTGAFTFLGLVNWWICVPPAGMLALYVLLLREIAMADAELARKRAAWEAHEARARERALRAEREAERIAYEASSAGAGAQIIDISGRVSDQLYDQYADAAVRAVGD